MYRCPTKLGQDVMQIGAERKYSGLDLTVRIAHPGDKIAEVFKASQAVKTHYQLADYHVEANGGSLSTTLEENKANASPSTALEVTPNQSPLPIQ